MKRILFLACLCLFASCDDGDLQIETIDFDSVDPQTCGTVDLDTQLFFKINGDEALILELQSGLLKNEPTEADITSTIGSQSKLTYRLFSDNVSSDYFCADVPLTEPTVINEIVAQNGMLTISTAGVETDTVTFNHTITLSDVSFITGTDARITDLSINEFGTVSTTKTE